MRDMLSFPNDIYRRSAAMEGGMHKPDTTISAYNVAQAAVLTGLTKRELAYWDSAGFFKPYHSFANAGSPMAKIYTFHDIVGLRVIYILKHSLALPLKEQKEAALKLSQIDNFISSDMEILVSNHALSAMGSGMNQSAGDSSGEKAIVTIAKIAEEMRREIARLRHRDNSEFGKINRNRAVMNNQPVFAGTRIRINIVQSFSEAGYSMDQILREYPTLTVADIAMAIAMMDSKVAA